jgi:hypothetical protein
MGLSVTTLMPTPATLTERREDEPMDEQAVRDRAEGVCAALVAGDIARATEDFSTELRKNLGEVLALLPLPSTEATVESVEHGGAGYNVVLRLVGGAEEVLVQTRWKDRDGRPTVVEASHLSRTVAPERSSGGELAGEGGEGS